MKAYVSKTVHVNRNQIGTYMGMQSTYRDVEWKLGSNPMYFPPCKVHTWDPHVIIDGQYHTRIRHPGYASG
ncbi:hypothetical protein C8J55DRAFT_507044 [Lentinula edodes]|uniref:Uncharacterized protein n=1 Tax=Lentinula lateritia TaxID=40482 RepID=A0A9W9ANH4_9AGAR|nr:hypothetical protein C8J55DRAFT_507044 [Lentinula edodes]